MNILVTGANGQLGNAMRMVSLGSDDCYIFTDVTQQSCETLDMLHSLAGNDVPCSTEYLDITDRDAVIEFVRDREIDAIVNCAAFTNVDAAQSNQSLAEKLNADAPANLASAMAERGGVLVHISTDYVFGKEPYNTPCDEERTGTPTGVYGLSKLHGEERIKASHCRHLIIRTAWLYSEFGKNFCRTMLSLTASKPQLKVVFDQVGTPTYALDLARAIFVMLAAAARGEAESGIFNFSDEGVCSWFDFARMIQEFSGHKECKVMPCHSCEFPSPVIRPAYSVLDKTKIKLTFGVEVPYWTDSLKVCIDNIKNYKIGRI